MMSKVLVVDFQQKICIYIFYKQNWIITRVHKYILNIRTIIASNVNSDTLVDKEPFNRRKWCLISNISYTKRNYGHRISRIDQLKSKKKRN